MPGSNIDSQKEIDGKETVTKQSEEEKSIENGAPEAPSEEAGKDEPDQETEKEAVKEDPAKETDKEAVKEDPAKETDKEAAKEDPAKETDKEAAKEDPAKETDKEAAKEDPAKETDKEAVKEEPAKEAEKKSLTREEMLEMKILEMEEEIKRLKQERLAYQQEQMRMEEKLKAAETAKGQTGLQMENTEGKPERKAPEMGGASGKGTEKKAPSEAKPAVAEQDQIRTRKGNYVEMKLGDGSISGKQADEAAKMKVVADMSVLAKKSSREFKMMQKAVERFDKFMKGMNGRTTFTAEEMERYDKLSHDVYKASDEYLKKKEQQIAERKPGKDGKKKQSDYEYSRIKAAEEIRESVEKMRQEMLEKAVKEKTEEMRKRCEQQLSNLEKNRDKLAGQKDMDPAGRKRQLADNVSHTIYYASRMRQLTEMNELRVKPGETLSAAMDRMDASVIPEKKEIDGISKHPAVKNIVANGEERMKNGQSFANDDMGKLMNKQVAKSVQEVKKTEKLAKEQSKSIQKQAKRQAQKQTKRQADVSM